MASSLDMDTKIMQHYEFQKEGSANHATEFNHVSNLPDSYFAVTLQHHVFTPSSVKRPIPFPNFKSANKDSEAHN